MPPSVPIPFSASTHDNNGYHATAETHAKKKVVSKRKNIGKKALKKTRFLSSNRDGEDSQEEPIPVAPVSDNNALGMYNNSNMMIGSTPYGMHGSPYPGGMGMGMGMGQMMMGGPFSGLYQMLFGVQNVVFSLSQAVQIIGSNQQALQQALDSLTSMAEHAIATFHEMRTLEAVKHEKETEEQKVRRRRLKAIRWALLMGGSWLVYKIIRRLSSRRRRLQYEGGQSSTRAGYSTNPGSWNGAGNFGGYGSMHGPSTYGGYNSGSPYGALPMYGGGGYVGPSGSYF